jgi:hypothetical protein
MADFSVNPVAQNIKPPAAMSLADMVNLARGAQEFQQAQQLNPLAVKQAQQQLQTQRQTFEQAQQMNPMLLQKAGQEARTGEIALSVEEQKDIERKNLQTFFADPNNFQTNGRIDLDKINSQVPKIAPLTGADAINKYSTLGQAQTQAISAKQNLTKDQRSMIAQRFSILGRLGVQDKNAYIAEMDLMKEENPENSDLHKLLDAYKTTWTNSMQSGPDLPGKAIAGAATLMTPEQQQTQFGTKAALDAQGRVITTTPSIGNEKPKVEVSIPQGLQPQTPQGANVLGAAGSEVAPGVRLPYPKRSPDQPYTPQPTEEKDQAAGFDYRNNLVNAQIGLPQARRNTEEVMKSANEIANQLFEIEKQGGFVGNIGRKIRTAIGSDKYDLLTKDLAQQALTQSKTMGSLGVTVGGLDMQAVANGTVKIPPDVLVTIAKRIEADRTNMDMQANGSQNFFQKFGDNNQKAFIQAWNANAKDTRIFEAINAMKNETDPTKMQNEFKKLFPKQSEFEDALTRYQNLKSLEATGVPIKPLKPLKR